MLPFPISCLVITLSSLSQSLLDFSNALLYQAPFILPYSLRLQWHSIPPSPSLPLFACPRFSLTCPNLHAPSTFIPLHYPFSHTSLFISLPFLHSPSIPSVSSLSSLLPLFSFYIISSFFSSLPFTLPTFPYSYPFHAYFGVLFYHIIFFTLLFYQFFLFCRFPSRSFHSLTVIPSIFTSAFSSYAASFSFLSPYFFFTLLLSLFLLLFVASLHYSSIPSLRFLLCSLQHSFLICFLFFPLLLSPLLSPTICHAPLL